MPWLFIRVTQSPLAEVNPFKIRVVGRFHYDQVQAGQAEACLAEQIDPKRKSAPRGFFQSLAVVDNISIYRVLSIAGKLIPPSLSNYRTDLPGCRS
jgi:hypothetical protein